MMSNRAYVTILTSLRRWGLFVLGVFCWGAATAQEQSGKLRVMVLSDIENEPDDAESLVRFMLYTNQWDVEGLIATTSVHQPNKIADWRMHEIVSAYGKVRDHLLLHEKGWPTASLLDSVVKRGRPACGMAAVGPGMDSEGSDWIIRVVDRALDVRPVWICIWGGPNCLAQALWSVRATRSPAELARFVAKLRVYAISDQDDSGPWIRRSFPGLWYIVSPGQLGAAYHYSTWAGMGGDHWYNFTGADTTLISNEWLLENVRVGHGALGLQYPAWKYAMEGDTPSFLYLVGNGLGDPAHPDWGSWGGRYELYTPRYRKWLYEPETRPIWTNAEDEVRGVDGKMYISDKATIWRWRAAYQNDLAARMDWCVRPFAGANHPPVVRLGGTEMTVHMGDTIRLDASASGDPDGDVLHFEWMQYEEAGSYAGPRQLVVRDADRARAWMIAPKVAAPATVHLIVSVRDGGTPALTRYGRVVVNVLPR